MDRDCSRSHRRRSGRRRRYPRTLAWWCAHLGCSGRSWWWQRPAGRRGTGGRPCRRGRCRHSRRTAPDCWTVESSVGVGPPMRQRPSRRPAIADDALAPPARLVLVAHHHIEVRGIGVAVGSHGHAKANGRTATRALRPLVGSTGVLPQIALRTRWTPARQDIQSLTRPGHGIAGRSVAGNAAAPTMILVPASYSKRRPSSVRVYVFATLPPAALAVVHSFENNEAVTDQPDWASEYILAGWNRSS